MNESGGGGMSNRRKNIRSILITALLTIAFFVSILPANSNVNAQLSEKVLSIGFIESIDSANPYLGIQGTSYIFYGMIYDYLICPDEDMEPRPNLASSWWYMDGQTAAILGQDFSGFIYPNPADWPLGSIWEYNITQNVFWNDGEPFTAYDVEWTINVQIGDDFYSYWAYQPYTLWIEHAEAVNDYKVRIFFSERSTKLPVPISWGENLCIPIMPKHIFESRPSTYLAYDWDGVPAIGTGPFMGTANLRQEVIAGEFVTLVKNPYYDFIDPADGIRKGLGGTFNRVVEIDKILMRFFSEEATLSLAVRTGVVDTARISTATYLQWLSDPSLPDTLNLVSILPPNGYSKEISINAYADAPGILNPLRLDPAVQRAAALATNKSFIIDQVYKGLGVPGVGLISPVWPDWYWAPGDETSWFNLTDGNGDIIPAGSYSKPMKDVMEFDLDLANDILDAAGYVWTGEVGNSVREAGPLVGERMQHLFGMIPAAIEGETLEFEMVIDYTNQEDRQIGIYVSSEWKNIGIDAYPLYVDDPTWAQLIYSYTYNTMLTYWSGDIDPNYLLYIPTSYALFGWNEFGTNSAEYDLLYLMQAFAMDSSEREFLVDECIKWQYLSGSIITTVYPKFCYAYSEERWTNWSDWNMHPGMSLDAFWGENPLWYSLRSVNGPPTASFSVDKNIGVPNAIFTFDASLSSDDRDPVASLEVRWDWEDDGIWDTVWITTKAAQHQYSSPGIYTIRLEVKDTGNQIGNTTKQVAVIDDEPPMTSASLSGTLGQNDWYVSAVNVSLIPSDNWSAINWTKYQLNGGDWQEYNEPFIISENGYHNITLYSADIAGNEEENQTIMIKIDQEVPTLTIFEQNETIFHSSTVTISWSGSDSTSDIDCFEYSLDGSAFASCGNETSIELSNIRDGTHELVIRAIDKSGNTAEQTLILKVNTNVFSLGGPIGPWLYILIIIVAAIVVATLLFYMRHRSGGLDKTPPISSESTTREQIEEIPPPPDQELRERGLSTEEVDPLNILKSRLAKGEISAREYEKLRKLLKE